MGVVVGGDVSQHPVDVALDALLFELVGWIAAHRRGSLPVSRTSTGPEPRTAGPNVMSTAVIGAPWSSLGALPRGTRIVRTPTQRQPLSLVQLGLSIPSKDAAILPCRAWHPGHEASSRTARITMGAKRRASFRPRRLSRPR